MYLSFMLISFLIDGIRAKEEASAVKFFIIRFYVA